MTFFITVVSKGLEKPEDKKMRNERRALEKYCMCQECISSDTFIFAVSESTSGSTRNIETLISNLSFLTD